MEKGGGGVPRGCFSLSPLGDRWIKLSWTRLTVVAATAGLLRGLWRRKRSRKRKTKRGGEASGWRAAPVQLLMSC